MKKNKEKIIHRLAILAVILLIALLSPRSGFSGEVGRLGKDGKNGGTENALPAVPDASGTIAFKLSDASSLAALTTDVLQAYAGFSKFGGVPDTTAKLASSLEMIREFALAASEMSLLITPSDTPSVYLSLFVNEEAFDNFVSGRREFERWPGAPSEGTGWTLKIETPAYRSDQALYILKLHSGRRTMVLISDNARGVADMANAALGISPGFKAERVTAGDSYYQIKFRDGVTVGDIIEHFTFNKNSRGLMETLAADLEYVLWSRVECSWTLDGETLSMESYSDMFQLNNDLAARKATVETADIFGEGDLAYFFSVDADFLLRFIFLGANDPVGFLFSLAGDDFPPLFSERELRKIVDSGVLSIVCVADGPSISTAYLLLESEAPEVVDKLFSLSYLMRGRHAEIQGWENAMTWPVPIPGFPEIVLAKNGGALLIGLGSDESLGKKLTVPEAYEPYVSRDNAIGVIVTPRLLDIMIDLAELAADLSEQEMSSGDELIYEAITSLRDSFELICGRFFLTGKGDGKIVFSEGGNLLGSYLKLLSAIALPGDNGRE